MKATVGMSIFASTLSLPGSATYRRRSSWRAPRPATGLCRATLSCSRALAVSFSFLDSFS